MTEMEQGSYSLFKNRLTVKFPQCFKEMDQEKACRMFPYEGRPQVIMESETGDMFCTFSLLREKSLSDSQIKAAVSSMAQMIISLYPASKLSETEVFQVSDGRLGWFEYTSTNENGTLHNYMYLFVVDGSMMLGTIGCQPDAVEQEQHAIDIMRSLYIPEKKWSISGGWQ